MLCPRCGAPTEVRESRLFCTSTDMEFSEVVHHELDLVVASPPQDVERSSVRWGGSWHCPADATLMTEEEGRVFCPSCDRSLPGRLIYNLIEFHVHPKTTG